MAATAESGDENMEELCHRARELATVLTEHSHFLMHVQDVLVHDVWGRMPMDWQTFLDNQSLLQLTQLPLDYKTSLAAPSSLATLLGMRDRLALPRRPPNSSKQDDASFVGVLRPTSRGAKLAKKTHEVEQLAALVCSVAGAAGCSRVLDVGCGKGSLASQLAVVDGLHVVGLEAQEAMAATAAKAAPNAATSATPLPSGGSLRLWHRTIAADEHAPQVVQDICADAWPIEGMGGADSHGGGGGGKVDCKVDSEEDATGEGVLLCALHACGDLSSTITRSFAASARCRAIVLIPCCYNLLTVNEDPCGVEHTPMKCVPCETVPLTSAVDLRTARVPSVATAAAATSGFPLSACVRSTGLVLTRDARMVSVQREAAGLAPSWLEEAQRADATGRESGVPPVPPASIMGQLFICLFAALVRAHYADLVPEGTRLSTGGYRKHRKREAKMNEARRAVVDGHEGQGRGERGVRSGAGDDGSDANQPISGDGGAAHMPGSANLTHASEFAEFAVLALSSAGLPLHRLDHSALSDFAHDACHGDLYRAAHRIAAFTALRASLAPLVESLVLIDHLIFLHEDGGCEGVRAVPVFLPAWSPRNVAIVAIKTKVKSTVKSHMDRAMRSTIESNMESENNKLDETPEPTVDALCMSDQELTSLPPSIWSLTTLTSLDISRNRLEELPDEVGSLRCLGHLYISHNRLRALPTALGNLEALVTIAAQSNRMRPAARSLPLKELGALANLRLLDLRFNSKLNSAAALLAEHLPLATCLLVTPAEDFVRRARLLPGHTDAATLQSQLEPLCTSELRRRLVQEFGYLDPAMVHPDASRDAIMRELLAAYSAEGPKGRVVRQVQPRSALSQGVADALLAALRSADWSGATRERLSVSAEGYVTLRRPLTSPPPGRITASAKLHAVKLARFKEIWELAASAMREADPEYEKRYTKIAISKGFNGSPHIDSYDQGPQYALSLGSVRGPPLTPPCGLSALSRLRVLPPCLFCVPPSSLTWRVAGSRLECAVSWR